MTHRLVAAALLAALGLVAWLVPQGTASAGDTPVEPPAPTVLPATDDERTRVFDTLAQAASEKSVEKLVAAMRAMQERKHADFPAEIRKHLQHDDLRVQASAIYAAASQEMKDVEKDVRKILRAKPKKGASGTIPGAVAAACIEYLGRLGFAGEEASVLDDHLKVLIGDERRMKQGWARDMLRACLYYLGRHKYKPAVPYLIDEMVADPVPENPNDPKNPPASYWEARHKLWEEYEGWARWALKETTGQQFRSVREWQAWMKQQDKKAFK